MYNRGSYKKSKDQALDTPTAKGKNKSVTTEVGRMHDEFRKLSGQRIFRKRNDRLRQAWLTGTVRSGLRTDRWLWKAAGPWRERFRESRREKADEWVSEGGEKLKKVNRDGSGKFCYSEPENKVGAGKGCGIQLLPGRAGDKLCL